MLRLVRPLLRASNQVQVACHSGKAWKSDTTEPTERARPIKVMRKNDEAKQIDKARTSDLPKPSSSDVRFDAVEKCAGDEPVKLAEDNMPYQQPRRV